jgi:hypothetical protein
MLLVACHAVLTHSYRKHTESVALQLAQLQQKQERVVAAAVEQARHEERQEVRRQACKALKQQQKMRYSEQKNQVSEWHPITEQNACARRGGGIFAKW